MEIQIADAEREYLRGLARRQAEYAALPVMEERARRWYALNDATEAVPPPVIIETWTFDRDFLPENLFQCVSPAARSVERQLLRNIRNHELINDDKVISSTFRMWWTVEIDEMGLHIAHDTVKDAQGYDLGFQIRHPFHNLPEDLERLRPAACRVDREDTLARKAFLDDLLGDILPVQLDTDVFGCLMLTERVIELLGMETFFLALYDCPDAVHRLMAYLRDNALRVMRWAEAENLLRLNNANQDSFGSSYNFTRRLPAPGATPGQARLCDMWGAANSQETVGLSPALFHEFCFPYYRAVCEPLGLLYYGCCEPAHPFWDDIRQLPHLKKVSISRWCNEGFMGEALQGTGVVYSRKPDPNLLGVHAVLDEDAWTASIRQTLEHARRVPVEFIVRDVYSLQGNLAKAGRAVELARAAIAQHWNA